MNRLSYPVVVQPLKDEDGGGFIATAPDLPGCMSDGETPEEALKNVQDAIAAWIEAANDMGRKIPKPSKQLALAS
ncbi:MAG: type II toxin-antitoxin system HicB family antitoxin [Aestuariivirga sp.]|jgi:antitoxin HicB